MTQHDLPVEAIPPAGSVPSLTLVPERDTDRSWELRYPPPDTAAVLAALLDSLSGASCLTDLAEEIVELAVELCAPVDSASITVLRGHTLSTLAATDERAQRVDAAQYHEGRGPCVVAVLEERMTQVTLPATSGRTGWRRSAERFGFRCVTSLPMTAPGFTASLNLYSSTRSPWGPANRDVAETLAAYGTDALLVAARLARRAR